MFKHKIISAAQRLGSAMKGHAGEIAYYGCVLAALTVIAFGAEAYRTSRNAPAQAALPAAQIAQAEPEEPRFILPEGMRLLRAFSAQPQWNTNDMSWQAHPAADYACNGGAVRALSAGIVETVGESGVCGGFMEVRLDEILLKYCCLQPADDIEPGAEIRRGDVIGWAENSMPGEMHLDDHLHLEAYREGKAVNPETLYAAED